MTISSTERIRVSPSIGALAVHPVKKIDRTNNNEARFIKMNLPLELFRYDTQRTPCPKVDTKNNMRAARQMMIQVAISGRLFPNEPAF
jgi:hypothetical protein